MVHYKYIELATKERDPANHSSSSADFQEFGCPQARRRSTTSTTQVPNPTYPFRVFISHKVSGHGGAAEAIKHELENYAPDKLKIFASPALSPGVKWRPKTLKEIETADLFILLYLVEGLDMDWCLYEAGYFEKTGRKLICVTNPGRSLPGPLETRQRLEATERGVERLLKAIDRDPAKPVRPDLFERKHTKTLDQLIQFTLTTLKPVNRQALCPRLWIRLSGSDVLAQLEQTPRRSPSLR